MIFCTALLVTTVLGLAQAFGQYAQEARIPQQFDCRCPSRISRYQDRFRGGREFFVGKFMFDPTTSPHKNYMNVLKSFGYPTEAINANTTVEISRADEVDLSGINTELPLYHFVQVTALPERNITFESYFKLGVRNTTTFEGKLVEFIVDIQNRNTLTMNFVMADYGFGSEKYVFDRNGLTVIFDLPKGLKGQVRLDRVEEEQPYMCC